MINTIHTKLVATLNALKGTNQPLSVVYSEPLEAGEQISGYPAVVVSMGQFTNDYYSTAENRIGVTYNLYLITEVEQAGMSKAHRILRETVDKVITKFVNDWSQGATTDGHRIWWGLNLGNSFYDSNEKLLYYELNLTANLGVSIT
jgi:hypothetical protein